MNKSQINCALLGLLIVMFILSCTKRQPEEADYAPGAPFSPYPPDSATNIDHTTTDVTLRWSATDPNSGDVLTYDIYFDTLNPPEAKAASALTAPSFFLPGLAYNTTYYWKLYITDDKGTTTAGPVWRFTTLPHANQAPSAPVYDFPADCAVAQYPTLYFSWNCTDHEGTSDTIYYDFYYGLSNPPSFLYSANGTGTIFLLSDLFYSHQYFWQVVARDNHGAQTPGPVYSFNTRSCPWYYKNPMTSVRKKFATAVFNDKIYLIGGSDISNTPLQLVEEYDPVNDTWTRRADMPTPRQSLGTAIYNNLIYTFGGGTDKIEVFDPSANTWSSKNNALGPMGDASAQTFGKKIYVNSNYGVRVYDPISDTWWDTTYTVPYIDTLTGTICYDTVYTWAKLNFLGGHPVVINSQLYFIQISSGIAIYRYYQPLDTFIQVTFAGQTIFYSMSGAVAANDYLYILGGYENGSFSKYVGKIDVTTGVSYIRSDMQTARASIKPVFVGNCIYVFGGLNAVWLTSVEEYRLEEDPKNIPVR
jgi:hypothetical protein